MKDATRPEHAGSTDAVDGGRSPAAGIVIRNLDRPEAIPAEGSEGGRTLRVCLAPPRAVAGALLESEEFEGAWIEDRHTARFRIGGEVIDGEVPVPDGTGPGTVRAWLTGELARRVPGARVELADLRVPEAGPASVFLPKSH